MRSTHRRLRGYGTIAAAAAAVGTLAAGAPVASADAVVPIAPHQVFAGDVNGVAADAVITVGCFGPVTPTSTGHPISGQTVAVHLQPASTTKNVGYTGESADRIVVQFDGAPSVSLPVTLKAYDVKAAIPTSLELPCYGPGKVAFVPAPTSSTARTAVVAVSYVSIGV